MLVLSAGKLVMYKVFYKQINEGINTKTDKIIKYLVVLIKICVWIHILKDAANKKSWIHQNSGGGG